jgi:multiple sugar transport system ATP-binding protein
MTMATRIAVMNAGVIQQIGTPDEIYERPANLFVGQFIGSPAMNTLPAAIVRGGGEVAAIHTPTGVRIDLSGYNFSSEPKDGEAVIVGLRPEHFSIGCQDASAPDGATGASFSLPVRYTEKTGSDVTAFLDSGDGGLIAARFDHKHHHVPRTGEKVEIHYPSDRFDVFDAATEKRI